MTNFENPKSKDLILEGTQITMNWIIQHLREECIEWQQQYEKCTVKNIRTEDVSEGKGFVSKIFRIHFEFSDDGVKPYDVVAKIPISSKLEQVLGEKKEQLDSLKDQLVIAVHNAECEFYTRHHVENLRIPNVFFCQKFDINEGKQGAIIMEYQANAVSLPLHQSFSLSQLKALAQQIALLQAYSLSISQESIPNPPHFENTTENFSDMVSEGCKNVSDENPELKEACQKLIPLITSKYSVKRLLCDLSQYLGISRVLAHSDLWNNNVMWKLNEDGSCSDELVCILDWQIVHFGAPGEDFGRILIMGTDPEIRHEAEEILFDIYYETLTKTAAEQNIAVPFKVEDVIKSYQCFTVLQALGLMFVLSKLTLLDRSTNSDEEMKKKRILAHRVLIALEDAYKNAVRNNMFEWPHKEAQ
ncbi:hypothetical protein AB6A40_003070 [Gnathostoma spinigerum]|uniref:CHK kinase-like domain-containing protein n=1 Tax=Gnathostoma spinigerum TaxID=75299 RepID=A0ABD6EG41_9BILA